MHNNPSQRAVAALNGLQTNASVLEQIRRDRKKDGRKPRDLKLTKMCQYLERTGLKVFSNIERFELQCSTILQYSIYNFLLVEKFGHRSL